MRDLPANGRVRAVFAYMKPQRAITSHVFGITAAGNDFRSDAPSSRRCPSSFGPLKTVRPSPSLGLSSSRRSPSVLKLFPRRGRYFAQAHLQLLPGMITVRFGPRQPPCRGRFFLVVVLAGAFPL